eukprot:CAMPEP_0119472354 /NCGR_PEP_ID=MMETSP1344-20130328/4451_1 /TAXON_ID=236787 /ORGANISM="Florenciella parvula, Strain CCMP2471" /LENGTH=82 /DNA_ID=CAMNT_0007505285 /DNA_START=28 /DNA_END=273 /DNA_ORIENTATION=+
MAALEEETADGKKPWTSDGAALEVSYPTHPTFAAPLAAAIAAALVHRTGRRQDSNVANIGSEEDKAARKAAAEGEEAWVGCG